VEAMKIDEVINVVDALKPNAYTKEEKIRWLSNLDSRVKVQIMDVHEDNQHTDFKGYDDLTKLETELLVSEPYDEMYLRWLEAMIDYNNGDDDRYNSAIILFNSAYESYKRYYTRTHTPLSQGDRFVF
jgi:hypothetical protein